MLNAYYAYKRPTWGNKVTLILRFTNFKKMCEKQIEKKLRVEIGKLGGIAIKLQSQYYTGLPDRMILMPGGRIRFAEIKTTGKKPTPRQKIVHQELRGLGFQVDAIDDEAGLQKFLEELEC